MDFWHDVLPYSTRETLDVMQLVNREICGLISTGAKRLPLRELEAVFSATEPGRILLVISNAGPSSAEKGSFDFPDDLFPGEDTSTVVNNYLRNSYVHITLKVTAQFITSLRSILENLQRRTVGSLRIDERETEEISADTASKYAEFADFLLCTHRIEVFSFFASEEMISRLPDTFLAADGIQALRELKFSVGGAAAKNRQTEFWKQAVVRLAHCKLTCVYNTVVQQRHNINFETDGRAWQIPREIVQLFLELNDVKNVVPIFDVIIVYKRIPFSLPEGASAAQKSVQLPPHSRPMFADEDTRCDVYHFQNAQNREHLTVLVSKHIAQPVSVCRIMRGRHEF